MMKIKKTYIYTYIGFLSFYIFFSSCVNTIKQCNVINDSDKLKCVKIPEQELLRRVDILEAEEQDRLMRQIYFASKSVSWHHTKRGIYSLGALGTIFTSAAVTGLVWYLIPSKNDSNEVTTGSIGIGVPIIGNETIVLQQQHLESELLDNNMNKTLGSIGNIIKDLATSAIIAAFNGTAMAAGLLGNYSITATKLRSDYSITPIIKKNLENFINNKDTSQFVKKITVLDSDTQSQFLNAISQKKEKEWIQYSLSNHLDINATDTNGLTLLMATTLNLDLLKPENLKRLEALLQIIILDNKAEINKKTISQNTALHYLLYNLSAGDIPLIKTYNKEHIKHIKFILKKFFIERNANLCSPNKHGKTPLSYYNKLDKELLFQEFIVKANTTCKTF